jgi:hypothetical protein
MYVMSQWLCTCWEPVGKSASVLIFHPWCILASCVHMKQSIVAHWPVWPFSFFDELTLGFVLQAFFALLKVTHIVCGWRSTRSKSELTTYEVWASLGILVVQFLLCLCGHRYWVWFFNKINSIVRNPLGLTDVICDLYASRCQRCRICSVMSYNGLHFLANSGDAWDGVRNGLKEVEIVNCSGM